MVLELPDKYVMYIWGRILCTSLPYNHAHTSPSFFCFALSVQKEIFEYARCF